MVELLIGKKGTGKTKALIEKVNNALTVAKGNVVFISNDTNRNIFDVKSKARMADTSEFEIKSYDEFVTSILQTFLLTVFSKLSAQTILTDLNHSLTDLRL